MKIKEYIRQRGMNVNQLAAATGISYMTLNDLYKGRTSLSRTSSEHLYKISKALDVPMEELLDDYMIEAQAGFAIPAALIDIIKEVRSYDKNDPYGFRIEALDNLENFSKDYCLEGALTWKQRDDLIKMLA